MALGSVNDASLFVLACAFSESLVGIVQLVACFLVDTPTSGHVRADRGRVVTVAVPNVGIPSPRGELLTRKNIFTTAIHVTVFAAVAANPQKGDRDLFAR